MVNKFMKIKFSEVYLMYYILNKFKLIIIYFLIVNCKH